MISRFVPAREFRDSRRFRIFTAIGIRFRSTGGSFMIVGIPRESYPGERRVAIVPAVLPALLKAGLEIIVEAGAGAEAGYPDATYTGKGAKIVANRAEVFRAADIVVQVLCYGSDPE